MTREEIHKLPWKAQEYINKLERKLTLTDVVKIDSKQLKLLGIGGFVRGIKRTLERKEAAYSCVNTWYEKEYDSSTPDDEVASMDIKAAELNAQIKVLRYVLSEAGEL
jgi:transposase